MCFHHQSAYLILTLIKRRINIDVDIYIYTCLMRVLKDSKLSVHHFLRYYILKGKIKYSFMLKHKLNLVDSLYAQTAFIKLCFIVTLHYFLQISIN